MHSVGFSSKNRPNKIVLTDLEKSKRLTWAKKHKKRRFSKVLFSDECSVWLNRFSGKCWVRRKVLPKIFSPKYSPKIHLWGCLHHNGPVNLYSLTKT